MLVNTEELLALANGDVEADRLADLLDRLEECPESAAALQVLVSLKANREEALEALRIAADSDAASPAPFPRPSAQPTPSTGWVTQGLRLAASIAVVGILGVWAATSFLDSGAPDSDFTILATTDYANSIRLPGGELTADSEDFVRLAIQAFDGGRYVEAEALLSDRPYDETGTVYLFLGMSQYALRNFELAVTTLGKVREMETVEDDGARHQALWYEANALLALDSPIKASVLLEEMKDATGFRFQRDAASVYETLRQMLGYAVSTKND